MTIKHFVRRFLRRFKVDLSRYEPHLHPNARHCALMQGYGVNLVIDVGANTGEYGQEIRDLGYTGRIVSFEPLMEAFLRLKKKSLKDQLWSVNRLALGSEEKSSFINVAGNLTSSSILKMTALHESTAPCSKYLGIEKIEIKKLDSIWKELGHHSGSVWLKIDTQGYELEVLKGANHSLEDIATVQLEVSFRELYRDSPTIEEVFDYLFSRNYHIVNLQPGFVDRETGEMLQADFTFNR